MSLPGVSVDVSGDRFQVVYHIRGDEEEALARARAVCLEQTVEIPDDLVPEGDIRSHIVGRIESFKQLEDRRFETVISYAVELSGFELTQLLNVVQGNSSMLPFVRVERLLLPSSLLAHFKGPRFGREGLRELLGIPRRPLLCTALKPVGYGPGELAELAYRFALGGIDMIKDDHGIADQPFAPFEERVKCCADAVERANRQTGFKCIYVPNVTAPFDRVLQQARFARDAAAGALLFSPGLAGLDAMRYLADDDRLALPILSHPALQGSFVLSPDFGISHFALHGQITRLAGADAVIYPNWGGRFGYSREDCRQIAAGCEIPMEGIRPIFPVPAGGMSLDRVPEMARTYGNDVVFLIGGGLHKHGPDLVESCRYFRHMAEQMEHIDEGER
ncbi:MAG: RuBisCO large subunit C-terminal-like domain-containing protein [Rudaea sp.]